MKRIIAVLMFVCCVGFTFIQPVLAADSTTENSEQAEMLINVNSATEAELDALPGIGKVTAERIVIYRTEQGPFASVDELLQVRGVGKKVLEKIRPFVSIGS